MKYIIEVFSVMLVLVFNLLLCVSMLGVSAARRRQEQKGMNWKCSPTPTVDKATAGLRGSISIIDTGYHC